MKMLGQGAIELHSGATAGTLRAQGAIRSRFGATYCPLQGQGATEYLVLLAVVLIVALVSVALLGFFPGMASDAQITQSQMYWKSATPIAITDSGARQYPSNGYTYPYIFLKNTGVYPIRITGLIGGDGGKITLFYTDTEAGCSPSVTGSYNISDYFYMAPGEEKYFATGWMHGGSYCRRHFYLTSGASTGLFLGGAKSVCQNSTSSPGTAQLDNFGFEYIEYIDNQQITKRQIGKELIIKCREPI